MNQVQKQKLLAVIAQGCGQTLGLGLGQSKDIVIVFYQSTTEERQEIGM